MASLPPITQLGGNYKGLFEGYWLMLDHQKTGKIDAAVAASFLKKSQLREPVLHKVWNMSDPEGNGYLDKQGLFMALRLIATCQAGKEPSVANMALSDPPPKLAGVEAPPISKWIVEESDRLKYEKVFIGLQPSKDLLAGDKARPFMLSSKLPMDILGKIWALSDIDKDGSLDLDEFCVAMKLTSLSQASETLPAILPSSLIPPSKAGGLGASVKVSVTASNVTTSLTSTASKPDSSPSHASPQPPKKLSATPAAAAAAAAAAAVVASSVEWVVSAEMKSKYDGYFQGIDKDHDGYVSGEEARSLFMASNLQQPVLAHVWNLCDLERDGRLNAEQFALAMYLIAEKVRKKELPKELTPAMIPPSLRNKLKATPPTQPSSSSSPLPAAGSAATPTWGLSVAPATSTTTPTPETLVTSSASSLSASSVKEEEDFGFGSDFSAIQELDSITKEIQYIRKEKVELSDDIKAKQELIQQRQLEMEGFQEDVSHTSRQREGLEQEREQAQNLLEQLNTQKAKFEGQIAELRQNCDDEREEIERLKAQLSLQESNSRSQAGEMEKLKQQLEQLKKEELEYKYKVELGKAELEKLQKASHNLNSEITQVHQRIESSKEEHQSLNTALAMYTPISLSPPALSGVVNINDVVKLSAELHVPHLAEHDAISARATAGSSSPVSSLSGFSTNSHLEDGAEEASVKDDKSSSHPDPFSSTSSSRDPFAAFSIVPSTDSSFGGAGFTGKPSDLSAFDPFGGDMNDPFKSTAVTTSATGEELFKSTDLFLGANSSQISNSSSASSLPPSTAAPPPAVDPFSGQDPFSTDPFASSSREAVQPNSLWGNSGPFDVDPFGQHNIQTPTDPFAGSDPFADDPFSVKLGGGTNGSALNPFQVPGFGGPGGWKQDGKAEKKPS